MTADPMMKFGHDTAVVPAGRKARCSYYGTVATGSTAVPCGTADRGAPCTCERPSSDRAELAFFEARGPGTQDRKCCNCGYFDVAHDRESRPNSRACDEFAAVTDGHTYDSFYCGCRGWD